ncbi:uncharacterized protein LOC143375848 [Andrena cerasifolii]|uniref:uncharacterized protein LOC143375848 n=1 Tax=Andrena cerasifolii TaxID=2819439 RepID=UPI004037AD92
MCSIEVRTSTMFSPAQTKNHLLLLLVFVATFHRAIAENINPPIPCTNSTDCVQYSSALKDPSCTKGFCACKYGSEIKNCSSAEVALQTRNAELPAVNSCKHDQDCIRNAVCNTTISQCECQKEYILSANMKSCLKKAESIDSPCVEDNQCVAFLRNTTCQSGKCGCIPGYHFAANACYKTVDFGEACTRPEECALVEGATCAERNICDCPAETVANANKTRCLPAAREILENCVDDAQCSKTFSHASCIDQTCRCSNQYHYEPEQKECFLDIGLDQNCGNTYDCYQLGNESVTAKAVQCLKNVCVCADGFVREADKCVVNGGAHHLLETLLPFLVAVVLRVVFSRQI